MASKPITLRRHITLHAPVETVWQVLSQTSKVNHALGLPTLTFSERVQPNGTIEVVGASRKFGLPVYWVEQPFEWVTRQEFWVERVFERTLFIKSLTTGSRMQAASPTTTAVESFVTMIPRDLVGKLASRFILGTIMREQGRYLHSLAEKFNTKSSDYFPPARRVQVNNPVLQTMVQRLGNRPINQPILDNVVRLLRTGRDEDVATMRPFELADAWNVDRLATLRVFLHATELGMLDMNWDVLCPNCRVSRESSRSLRELQETGHCEVCHIRYDVNFDDYVELRFAVNPTIRTASSAMFCALGSPALNQHIVAQARLAAGTTRTITLELATGGYRVRMLGVEQRCRVQVEPTSATTTGAITLAADGVQEPELHCASGVVTLTCTNTSAAEQLLIIERDAWGSGRVSASLVTTLPEFRSLFSSEVLAPGLGLAIKNLTLLFSDIKNSTPMYEQWGDTSAFALVRDHFTVLFGAIETHNGSVVKTIGDAVMAVFADPTEAVAAALEMHQGIAQANTTHNDKQPLSIKIGLHSGPCIAVNANEVLDYFGTTVNAAARAQAVSIGDDVVITADVMNAPGVAQILAQHSLQIEQFTRDLKGLSQAYTLFRLTPR